MDSQRRPKKRAKHYSACQERCVSCALERKEVFKLYVRVGMGRMTDDAFNLELPSVECAQQIQKTETITTTTKNQNCNPTNKEDLLINKNETILF